jgi:S1-C subfamily serine protease
MADRDPSEFSRVCSSCGRRVPRSVAACRCGAALPPGEIAVPERAEAAPGGSTPLVAVALVAILAAGGAYWMFMRPAGSPTTATATPTAPIPTEAPAAAAAPAAPGVSAEARAWDAAANAKDTPPPVIESAPSVPPPTPAVAASIEEMVDRVMPAIVLVEATGGRGSGFFVRHDTLITNVHVVQNDGYVTLRRMDGSSLSARVETRAPAFDIAVLKVAQASPSQAVIPMGSAQSLRPGQEIIVIGSALGTLQNSVSRGIVSGLRTSGGATLVQTDAATNPGNSGGPMLDRNGAVIGITTMGYRNAEGLNFGVAIDHARDLLEGRQANLGSQKGLTDIQSQAGGSESDRRQQQGDEQFRANMGQLADAARSVDAMWSRFRSQCYKSPIGGRYDREWFAVLVPRGLPGDAAAGCISYYQAMEADIKQFKGMMQRSIIDARRANVLPGTIRDVIRTNKLDFDWDR